MSKLLKYSKALNHMGNSLNKHLSLRDFAGVTNYIEKLNAVIEATMKLDPPKIINGDHVNLVRVLTQYECALRERYINKEKYSTDSFIKEIALQYTEYEVSDHVQEILEKLEPSIKAYQFAKLK
ncbi:hypothetical protein [Paenibacillus sp. O199]|uniref:hypothetical protein n=1 Tax=Paenibacillus sp. O199 TaxID=1643925 RepID=UPI0007BF5B3E|nr:hypothetical protein [Paenibacillus sp. O199]